MWTVGAGSTAGPGAGSSSTGGTMHGVRSTTRWQIADTFLLRAELSPVSSSAPNAARSAVVDAWLNSDGHRRIMLRPEYREYGVGVATGAPKETTSGPGATYTLDLGVLR